MKGLISMFVDRRVTTTMLMGVLVVLGFLGLNDLGLELMPEIDFPMITVGTIYPGASSQEVESSVTKPVEQAIAQVKGVKTIKSISMENYSIVSIEFEWGTNLDFAAQDVRDGIGLIDSYLPSGVNDPVVWKFNMSQFPVLMYMMSSDTMDTRQLRNLINDRVKDRLLRLDGVASIVVWGGKKREIQVLVDENRLEAFNLPMSQVVNAIKVQNLNVPAGYIDVRQNEILLQSEGEFQSPREIMNVIVGATKDGKPIFVKDIAKVKDGYKTVRNHSRTNLKPSVLVMVTKESGANTVKTVDRVKAEMSKIEKELPKGVSIHKGMDQGHIVKKMLGNTSSSGIIGAILAILMMWLFLKDWRPTLIIGIAIPLSIVTTFMALDAVGYTLNFMTILGLSLGVGLLVDNAIVVIENIFRHQQEGDDRVTAAKAGASEVSMAISASTFTTIAVFFPLALVKGLTGQLTRGIGLTVGFAVLSSLFVALTLVPMLSSVFLRKKPKHKGQGFLHEGRWFTAFRNGYVAVLKWSLNHKTVVLVLAIIAFGLSIWGIFGLGMEFMPEADNPNIVITFKLPVGTKLQETDRISMMIEQSLIKVPGVTVVGGWVGPEEEDLADMSQGANPTDVNEAELWIRLKDKEKRSYINSQLREAIRKALPELNNIKFNFLDMGKQMMGGQKKPVVIKIFGPKWSDLMRISHEVAQKISTVKGIHDIDETLKLGKPELKVVVDRDKAAKLGLTSIDAAMAVQAATLGTLAGKYRESGKEYDIRVELQKDEVKSIRQVMSIPIATKAAGVVPLSQIASLKKGRGPLKVTRENKSRVAYVRASVEGRDLGSVMRDVKASIARIRHEIPQEYFIEAGGQYEDMLDTFRELAKAFAAALLLIYMIMASQFESFKHPFVIMFTLPLALIGVVLALAVTGQSLSFQSGAGIVILAGIVVNNAIVLIDYANQLRQRGMTIIQSLIKAGGIRLRPILITAGTTIFGMLPMVIGHSQGSEFRLAMATPLIGGLFFSTILTLVIIPVIYASLEYRTVRKEMAQKDG